MWLHLCIVRQLTWGALRQLLNRQGSLDWIPQIFYAWFQVTILREEKKSRMQEDLQPARLLSLGMHKGFLLNLILFALTCIPTRWWWNPSSFNHLYPSKYYEDSLYERWEIIRWPAVPLWVFRSHGRHLNRTVSSIWPCYYTALMSLGLLQSCLVHFEWISALVSVNTTDLSEDIPSDKVQRKSQWSDRNTSGVWSWVTWEVWSEKFGRCDTEPSCRALWW